MTALITLVQCSKNFNNTDKENGVMAQKAAAEKTKSLIAQGKEIFRFDDFGDKPFWSGLLHIDKAILGTNLGGFGPVSG